jgi:hypothetical protein
MVACIDGNMMITLYNHPHIMIKHSFFLKECLDKMENVKKCVHYTPATFKLRKTKQGLSRVYFHLKREYRLFF